MKLSISNIAWDASKDVEVYRLMKECGFTGLEIAPTRIFPETPYDQLEEAHSWSKKLKEDYSLKVPSMQSIWFGRQEKLFGSEEEREALVAYTKKAIDFAEAIGCKNLVFGCPRNRFLDDENKYDIGVSFFKEIGDYAANKNTVIGMEANPPIYNTNYINDTLSAIELIKKVDSKGFKLNLDLGTMIQNEEDTKELCGNVALINHVHVSEPGLKPIEKRELHKEVIEILKKEDYNGFVSIEMGKVEEINLLKEKMLYLKGVLS